MRPPSVDALARSLAPSGLPHPLLVDAARGAIAAGDPAAAAAGPTPRRALLQPVVNATGVLLHTNLGRAPLGRRPAGRVRQPRARPRDGPPRLAAAHAGPLLARACGAEAALVVNNGAAAVLLVLAALAPGGAWRCRGASWSRSAAASASPR